MGTRSFIAIQEDNIFKGVYCHWDGYLENNGKILHEHYQDEAKVKALINMGDISSLGAQIGVKHDFNTKILGSCTFYGRDRGESGVETRITTSLPALQLVAEGMGVEYFYLFKDSKWYVTNRGMQFFGDSDGSKMGELQALDEALLTLSQEDAA